MAFKLDDLINKKKEPNQILDLSKVKIRTKEEFTKYFDKIPEYKIRPEKVRPEDCRIRDNEFSFTYNKKEARLLAKHRYIYMDPIPESMKSVRLEDLAAVSINWRMLTEIRPNNKLEEEIFCRLVELGKLRLSTQKSEARAQAIANSGPGGSGSAQGIYVMKSKRGGVETRIRSCKECGEEMCSGIYCKEYPYDSYTRMMVDKEDVDEKGGEKGAKRRPSKSKNPAADKKGSKSGLKKKKKRKKRKKSSHPNDADDKDQNIDKMKDEDQ